MAREVDLGAVIGPQGPKGTDGMGIFALEGDADGNLWACYTEKTTAPEFETDTDGNIYFVIPEV